ncbi:MAG: inositol monophosphatase family protein, partial [Microvirga sp.]
MPAFSTVRVAGPTSSPAAKSDLRLSVACAVAREAGALARRRFNGRPGATGINLKGHQDYLSAVDAEVEGLVRGRLLESFPDDSFFGEEGGG